MKIVKVDWVDICSGTVHWSHLEDVEASPLICVSVGMVVKETDDIICIAQNYSLDENLVSDTMTFPKAIVTKVTVLEEEK